MFITAKGQASAFLPTLRTGVTYDDDDAEYDADDPPDKWGKSGLFHGTSGDTDEDDLK